MTKVYLIRHAESEGNSYRRAHGHFNGQITKMGHVQIAHLRQRFDGEKINHIYSSDLDRTVTTAKALSEPRNLKINKTPMLREVKMGIWEDISWGDIEKSEPEMSKLFGNDPAKWKTENSETYEQVKLRMAQCINDICEKHSGESVAVFSHGFAIRAFLCNLLGVESHETHKVPYCDNTAVTLLIYDDGKLSVEYEGDNSHLTDEISTFARQTWWREKGEKVKENLRYEELKTNKGPKNVSHIFGEITKELHFAIVYVAFLDDEPVGFFGLDAIDEDIGWMPHYYIKPEYERRNFLDQFIGQAIFALRKLPKKVMQVRIPSNSKDAKATFLQNGFNVVSEDVFVLLEKEIL